MTSPNEATVEATVQYLKNDQALAVYKASVAGGELVSHEGNYSLHTVKIENAREFNAPLDLDREGFQLLTQATSVKDFYADSQLADYEKEIKAVIKTETAASEVLIFDHTRRSSSADIRSTKKIREASAVIHNDYSGDSGHVRLKDFLTATNHPDSTKLLQKDFAIINVWRSIAGTIMNHPLAMCVATSVPGADLIAVKREGKERMGELQLMQFGESHRWCYFPQMTADEALMFKTFDSRIDGRTRFTPHTSFEDPTAPLDAPPRESIETRCFVFF